MSYSRDTVAGMGRKNRSISIPEDLSGQIDAAAAAEGMTPSAWLVEAARRRLRISEGLAAMDEWFMENGEPTPEEEEWARKALDAAVAYQRQRRREDARQRLAS